MATVLVFGVTLLAAVAFSAMARRSVLSTAVMFLATGLIFGRTGFDIVRPGEDQLHSVAEIALFLVLFTDGMHLRIHDARPSWRLPTRALAVGLPLTSLVIAACAWLLSDLDFVPALLLGVVLGPTDPVFAQAIIGRHHIPMRVRSLLNIESGLNDGLALPVVVVLIEVLSDEPLHIGTLVAETLGGVALGAAIGAIYRFAIRFTMFDASPKYGRLETFAVGVVVFGAAGLTGGNEFLAAFAAGAVMSVGRESDVDSDFDDTLAELVKLLAVVTFAAVLSPSFFVDFSLADGAFVALALLLARPVALVCAFVGLDLSRAERLTAYWFGPKGFASVLYALMVLEAGLADSEKIFHLAAIVVGASIIAHSSTDVLIAKTFEPKDPSSASPST
ncbi:MAG: cation:proton antiporter [Ilumatobacteraceae bacterium]